MDFIKEMLKEREEHVKMFKYFKESFTGNETNKSLNTNIRKSKIEMIDFAIATFLASQEEETIKPLIQEKYPYVMKIVSDYDDKVYTVPDELKEYITTGIKVAVKTNQAYGYRDVLVKEILLTHNPVNNGYVSDVRTDWGWVKNSNLNHL